MTFDQKKLCLEYLNEQGSLEYTRHAVAALQLELKKMAEQMGMLNNEKLTTLMGILKVWHCDGHLRPYSMYLSNSPIE